MWSCEILFACGYVALFHYGFHRSCCRERKHTCHSNYAASLFSKRFPSLACCFHVLHTLSTFSSSRSITSARQYATMTSDQPNSTPLHMSLETYGDNTMTPPITLQSVTVARPTMSPADCRTLKKLLNDVQNPSPLTSLIASEHDESSGTGLEDEVQYTEPLLGHGDEREEGYEDEDGSMELSDIAEESSDDINVASDEATAQDESVLRNVDDSVYVWSDGNTIEDIMNTPGKTAPPAPEQNLSGVYTHGQSTPEDIRDIKARRAEMERELEEEGLNHEQHDVAAIDDGAFGPDVYSNEEENDAVDLSDDAEFRAIEAVQAEIGMSVMKDYEEPVVELEVRIMMTPRSLSITGRQC